MYEASSNVANLWMTPSGDSVEAIQLEEELIQNSAFVEFRVHRTDSRSSEVSKHLTHHTRRPESLGATKTALGFGLRAHRF